MPGIHATPKVQQSQRTYVFPSPMWPGPCPLFHFKTDTKSHLREEKGKSLGKTHLYQVVLNSGPNWGWFPDQATLKSPGGWARCL
jgi:hypothetical protein